MIVDRSITIPAPAEEVFQRVLDIPFVGGCLPGAADIREDSPGTYRGRFSVKVGPVKVTLQGTVRVLEAAVQERRAVLRLEGADRGIGGNVSGEMTIEVTERGEAECQLVVHTDVTIAGRLGQFGQAVMLKKADQITEAFVSEFSRRLAERRVAVGAGVGGVALTPAVAADSVPAVVDGGGPVVGSDGAALAAVGGAPAPAGAVPAAAVHTLGALFRRGRHLVVCANADDARAALRSQRDLGALWMVGGGSGASAPGERPVPRVFAVEAGDVDALVRRLRQIDVGGPGVARAIAVAPRGAAVGDPALMAALCRRAHEVSQLPVLLVAGSPWAALTAARVAAGGAAHGVAVVPTFAAATGGSEALVAALVAESVAEIRSAGIELPVVAGPVQAGAPAAHLLAAGADGVLVRASRGMLAALVERRTLRRV